MNKCLFLLASLLLTIPVGVRATEPASARHSFLDPIGDFASDTIWKPTAPFELVPGKNPDGWGFVLEPYVWAMGLTGQSGVGGLPPANLHLGSKTVLQNLDWGIFARGEIRKGRWGLLADGYYADLSGSADLNNRIFDSVSIGLQQSLVSLALAYRVIDDRRGFLDVYAGARYNFIGVQIDNRLNDTVVGQLGDRIADDIVVRVTPEIDSFLRSAESAILADLDSAVSQIVSSHKEDIEDRALKNHEVRKLMRERSFRKALADGGVRRALDGYVRATLQAKAAAAEGIIDPKLQAAEASAKKKLGKAIASRIEKEIPSHVAQNEWWVDPIIGLRGQVNITRWLFLATQGDVGGFGAGSQIAWNVQATIGVNITRQLFAELGYRYMYVDYTSSDFLYKMNSYGLYSGFGVRF